MDKNEASRKRFEKWAKWNGHHSVKWYIDQYDSQKVQWMFDGWAAHATQSVSKETLETSLAQCRTTLARHKEGMAISTLQLQKLESAMAELKEALNLTD